MAFTVVDGLIAALDVYGDQERVRRLAEPVLKALGG
jgi:RNA polymerase sigma-70 factor (ECF subfamily)